MAFLGDLARRRSLASAALLLLMLVDEIEGLVFLAVGVLLDRMDLFMSSQEVLFPAIVAVSAVVAIVRNTRRRKSSAHAEVEPVEMMDAPRIIARIGEPLPAPMVKPTITVTVGQWPSAATISLSGLSPSRTSPRGWRSAFQSTQSHAPLTRH
jgi:hypothetical protein